MLSPKEPKPQNIIQTPQAASVDAEAANIQDQVQHLHDEQLATIEAGTQLLHEQPGNDISDTEHQYKAALDTAIEEKEEQAENLENRLEGMIDRQEAVLQQLITRQPGILSLPGQKSKWQAQIQQQQTLLHRLHNRLDTVKEIHEGMGLHSSRIQELATSKLRNEQPLLAEGWDEMKSAQRAHENLMRKQEKERKEKIKREQVPSLGKSNSLSLNSPLN